MARPSKADVQKPALIALIERGASVDEACAALQVGRRTFYTWEGADEEFRHGVARAREAFAGRADQEVQAALTRSLVQYLVEGETVERETTTTREGPDGKPVEVTKKSVERRPCPKWVFDKLMPDSVAGALHQHLHLHERDE